VKLARVLAVGGLVSVAVGGPIEPILAAEFNMAVTAAGIRPGAHVSGPQLSPESLANRVVLLEFWGLNCPPCIGSLPLLEELHTTLGPHGLVVIGAHAQGGTAEELKGKVAQLNGEWKKDKPFQAAVKAGQQLGKLEQMRAYVRDQLGIDADAAVSPEAAAQIPAAVKGQIRSLAQGIGKSVPGSTLADKAAAIAAELAP
jgi:thiol-disulfide isomerase/thioredoxin